MSLHLRSQGRAFLNLAVAAQPVFVSVLRERLPKMGADLLRQLVSLANTGVATTPSVARFLAKLQEYSEKTAKKEPAGSETRIALGAVWALRGCLERQRGDIQSALAAFKRADQLLAGDFKISTELNSAFRAIYLETLLAHGDVREALRVSKFEKPEVALATVDSTLARLPDNVAALFAQAALLLKIGRPREAAEAAKRAADIEPGRTDALIIMGNIREATNDLMAAARDYERGWVVSGDTECGTALGSLRFRLNDFEQALATADAVMAKDPTADEAVRIRARALFALRRARDALETLRSAPSTITSIDSLRLLATVARDLNDYDLAETSLSDAVRLGPQSPGACGARIEYLCEVGRFEEASEEVERIAPALDSAWIWNLSGRAREYTGAPLERVLESYERALQLVGDSDDAVWFEKDAANVLRSLGRLSEATAKYTRAIDLTRKRTASGESFLWVLGWCHLCLGRFSEAIGSLTAAATTSLETTGIDFDLGLAMLLANSIDLGVKQYEVAREHGKALHPYRRRGVFFVAYYDLAEAMRLTPALSEAPWASDLLSALNGDLAEVGVVTPSWVRERRFDSTRPAMPLEASIESDDAKVVSTNEKRGAVALS